MKNICLLLYISFCLSCSSTIHINERERAEIYDIKNEFGYTFYFATIKNDTMVFVASQILGERCSNPKNYIYLRGLEQVTKLAIDETDSICFTYKMYATTLGGYIFAGGCPPGEKHFKYVNSYYSLPYYINNCNAFNTDE
jgi:hypothetical protein